MSARWLLLHGFSGDRRGWAKVQEKLRSPSLALDLPGHGQGPDADPSAPFEAAALELLSRAPDPPPHLVGYSLGARLGLSLLILRPEVFERATLIGVNPGIEEQARPARALEDQRWSGLLRAEGIEAFERAWSALPLWASQASLPAQTLGAQRALRLQQDPLRLADAMTQLSLARMPSYWGALPRVKARVQLVVGALDHKFLSIAKRMAERLPQAELHLVEGVGHNVPLEAPARLAALLEGQA